MWFLVQNLMTRQGKASEASEAVSQTSKGLRCDVPHKRLELEELDLGLGFLRVVSMFLPIHPLATCTLENIGWLS